MRAKLDIHQQKNEIRPIYFTLKKKKNNFKYIKKLNLKPDIFKLLKGNMGHTLLGIGRGKNFLIRTSLGNTILKSNKWDNMKFKSFQTAKKLSAE